MNNYLVVAPSGTCYDFEGYSRELCFTRSDCFPTPNEILFSAEGDEWNCNLCQVDEAYHIPYVSGDKIMFQLQFIDQYNGDPTAPVTGWDTFVIADLCDADGNILSSLVADFASQYLVGWNGTNSYQVIEIDTSKAVFTGEDCFQLRFTAYDSLAAQTDQVVTQHFALADATCDNTLVIKGHYNDKDCYNHYYGYPKSYVGSGSFKYVNDLRFWANIRQRNVTLEKTLFLNAVTQSDVNDIYRVTFETKFPPYIHNYLAKMLLAAEDVFVDETEYQLDSFSSDNQVRNSNMFFYHVDLIREFEKDFRC